MKSRKMNKYGRSMMTLAVLRDLIDRHQRVLLDRATGRGATTDGTGESCPDLSDPSQPADIYLCQLLARGRFELGEIDCDEYVKQHNACSTN